VAAPEKIRDAQRSREAILEAAELLFSERGYDAASLGEIAAQAGLSRGTPSYFFGSKEQLYIEVLNHAFESRQEATEAAFEPVRAWAAGAGDLGALRRAVAAAAEQYMTFLARHSSFVQLIMREELAGGSRLRARTAPSNAMRDAFGTLRRVPRARGLKPFEVDDAIVLFVSLTFTPASYRNTLMRAVNRDPDDPSLRRRQAKLVAGQMMQLLAP
jgi:AcrR family transcriptional regulator